MLALSTQIDFPCSPLFPTSSSPLSLTSPEVLSSSSPDSGGGDVGKNRNKKKKTRVVRGSDGSLRPCSICGDDATGWHYDVLSCNGCKTFFRRTIISQRRFVCTRGGTCQFTKDFRCACRACRYEKCVQAGMNPKAIQLQHNGSPEHVVENIPASISSLNNEDFEYSQKLKLMMHREKIVQELRNTRSPLFPTGDLMEILRQPCLFGKHSFQQEDDACSQMEIYQKNPVMFWLVADLYLTVEYAKTFLCFQNMTETDQKCLLAHVGGVVEVASQSYYSVLLEAESLTFPDGTNALQHLLNKHQPRSESYYREIYSKPVALIRRLKLSMEEFVLFKALALFSPDEVELSKRARDDVARKRMDILKYMRRLMTTRHGPKGIEKLADCLLALPTFLSIAEKRKSYLLLNDLTRPIALPAVARSIFLGE